jgi:hypothetical protein
VSERPGRPRTRQLTLSGLLAALLIAVVVALADQLAGPSTATAPTGVPDAAEVQRALEGAAPGTALAAAGELAVKGRAPKTGYERERFGEAWSDVDRNGCDTRNDVLARDLDDEVLREGSDCVVVSGVLDDPYGPSTIEFRRGVDTSSAVQIDHVIALSDAWQKGAQQWSAGEREAFANDPLNLLAVDGPLNQAKSDGDAATWLPPNTAYRCTYVARQVAVKHDYGLWVTAAELAAVVGVLETCPDQQLPG